MAGAWESRARVEAQPSFLSRFTSQNGLVKDRIALLRRQMTMICRLPLHGLHSPHSNPIPKPISNPSPKSSPLCSLVPSLVFPSFRLPLSKILSALPFSVLGLPDFLCWTLQCGGFLPLFSEILSFLPRTWISSLGLFHSSSFGTSLLSFSRFLLLPFSGFS